MSDFFKKSATGVNGESIIDSSDIAVHKPERIDIRFHRQLATVTSANKVKDYKVKVWPTLSDGDENTVNALGIRMDMLEKRRSQVIREKKYQRAQYFAKQLTLAHAILEEEENAATEVAGMSSITLEEVEKIRADAVEEGKKEGHEEGFAKGLEDGKKEGFKAGYDEGVKQGSEQGYDLGVMQGKEDGFEKGHEEGLLNGQKVILEQAERFRTLSDALANPLREVDREVTDELFYLISRLVKVILKREIREDAEFIKKNIEQAMTILPVSKDAVTILLHPDDYAVVTTAVGADYIKSQHWDIKEDETLAPGDVRVHNNFSEINWRLDDRIDALLEQFLTGVYPTVDSALRESIEGCPEADALPKKPIAPRNLDDISQDLISKFEKRANTQEPSAMTETDAKSVSKEPEGRGEAMVNAPDAHKTTTEPVVTPPPQNGVLPADNGIVLTDLPQDPAPYMDDYGHPVYESIDGHLYFVDEENRKIYVDENGMPLDKSYVPKQAPAAT